MTSTMRTPSPSRRGILAAGLGGLAALAAGAARAQGGGTPIRLLVGFPAGEFTATGARLLRVCHAGSERVSE